MLREQIWVTVPRSFSCSAVRDDLPELFHGDEDWLLGQVMAIMFNHIIMIFQVYTTYQQDTPSLDPNQVGDIPPASKILYFHAQSRVFTTTLTSLPCTRKTTL